MDKSITTKSFEIGNLIQHNRIKLLRQIKNHITKNYIQIQNEIQAPEK